MKLARLVGAEHHDEQTAGRSRRCLTAERRVVSNINVSAQGRALPFTGLSTLPLLLLGAIVSIVGALMSVVRPKQASAPRR
jgi:hypothetical protein